ncbi:MAG: type III polyketide synthase [Planctomycetota bacterium]
MTDSVHSNCLIQGIGTAVPPHRIDRESAADHAGRLSCHDESQARKLSMLYRRSGVQHRGSVLLEESAQGITQAFYPPLESTDRGPTTQCRSERYAAEAPRLATDSASQALQHAGLNADQITHLVTITCTGFYSPGIDVHLIDALGLPRTTERVQVGFMGCHGAINGLRVATGMVARQPTAKVLMCSVELCSLHYQYGYDTDRIVSGALFADGSASLVLTGEAIPEMTNGQPSAPISVAATASFLVPNSRDAMTWLIGNHGYEMTLSATVPGLIEEWLMPFLAPWLEQQGESMESIQGWAVHPGGSRILSAVETALPIPSDALGTSREVLAEHGNMSSATMLMILDRFQQQQQPRPWVMLGFGPGLEVEVALIR